MNHEQQYPGVPCGEALQGKPENEPTILEHLAMQGIADLEFDIPVLKEFFRPAEFL